MLGLHAIGFLLAPLLLWQGRAVRRNTPVLPEPCGPRRGVIGKGDRLRLLVVGDSAAAGVGVAQQRDALAMPLARILGRDFRVEWELRAKTGETTASLLHRLKHDAPRASDVVLTSLGVNDVTAPLGLREWLRQQSRLRELLRRRYRARLVIVSGLPPMHLFPALPQPLRWYLGQRASLFDRSLEGGVANDQNCAFLSLRFSEDMSLAASDGFHPGPEIYAEWAERAAQEIRGHIQPDTDTKA